VNPLVIQIFHIPTFIQPNSERHTHMMTNVNDYNNQINRLIQQQALAYNQRNLQNSNDIGPFGTFSESRQLSGNNVVRNVTSGIRNVVGLRKDADITGAFANTEKQISTLNNAIQSGDSGRIRQLLSEQGIDVMGLTEKQLMQGAETYAAKAAGLTKDNKFKRKDLGQQISDMQSQYLMYKAELDEKVNKDGIVDADAQRQLSYLENTPGSQSGDVLGMLQARVDETLSNAGVQDAVVQETTARIAEAYSKKGNNKEEAYKAAVTEMQRVINGVTKSMNKDDDRFSYNNNYEVVQDAYSLKGNALTPYLKAQQALTAVNDLNPENIKAVAADKVLENGIAAGTKLEDGKLVKLANAGESIGGLRRAGNGSALAKGEEQLHDFDLDENGILKKGADGKLYQVVSNYDKDTSERNTDVYALEMSVDEFNEAKEEGTLSAEKLKEMRKGSTRYVQKQNEDASEIGALYAMKNKAGIESKELEKRQKKANEAIAKAPKEDTTLVARADIKNELVAKAATVNPSRNKDQINTATAINPDAKNKTSDDAA
jgi:hypothetical protein